MHFGVILRIFSQRLQTSETAPFSSEMLVLGGVEPPFLHYFYLLFEGGFCVAFLAAFLFDFGRFGLPNKSLLEVIFVHFANFA